MIFFGGSVIGTREGTIVCALLTGLVVKFFVKIVKQPIEEILCA